MSACPAHSSRCPNFTSNSPPQRGAPGTYHKPRAANSVDSFQSLPRRFLNSSLNSLFPGTGNPFVLPPSSKVPSHFALLGWLSPCLLVAQHSFGLELQTPSCKETFGRECNATEGKGRAEHSCTFLGHSELRMATGLPGGGRGKT